LRRTSGIKCPRINLIFRIPEHRSRHAIANLACRPVNNACRLVPPGAGGEPGARADAGTIATLLARSADVAGRWGSGRWRDPVTDAAAGIAARLVGLTGTPAFRAGEYQRPSHSIRGHVLPGNARVRPARVTPIHRSSINPWQYSAKIT
jgi:hypothetical protein